MDKRLILSVAGSGKTSYLVNQLDGERRFLIVTYTVNNTEHIRESIIKRFNYFPSNIHLYSYFQFLLRVCFNPFFHDYFSANGVYFKQIPAYLNKKFKATDKGYYLSNSGYLYHNRIAKKCQERASEISERIDKYYDCFFFDEIQDLAGHDFNLVTQIIPQLSDTVFVGDFYQHTFDTSRDGIVNKSLHGGIDKYVDKWKSTGLSIDRQTLQNSYRCTSTICDFVRDKLKIEIYSNRSEISTISFIDSQDEVDKIMDDYSTLKLFYMNSSKYHCQSMNWGASKGLDDFIDVCVVLNKNTLQAYKEDRLAELPAETRNKLYVACTRAKRNLYFIPHTLVEKYKTIN